MKTNRIIWTLLGQILFAAVFPTYAVTPKQKQKILESFAEKQILYNDSISIDSVITWSEEILPKMRFNTNKELYFLLQLQLANAYTVHGDISLATDRAQLMYEEAKASNYPFGTVIANQAIGDAYNTLAYMTNKALESYQDALTELADISIEHPYKKQLLLKISNVLQRKGRLKEADKTLKELEQLLKKSPDYPTTFFFYIEKANYAISHGHLSRDYLDEAKLYLQKMDSINQQHPEKFYRFHINYTTAAYYRAMGNWDTTYWDKSLKMYTILQKEYANNKRSTYYRWTSLEKIYLYKIQGKIKEACLIYQELYPPKMPLASQSYIRQINSIKAQYQIDKIAIASNKEYNKIISTILIGSIALLIVFTLLAFRLKKQQNRIALSTHNLALLRTRSEKETRSKSVFISNMSHEIRTPLNALSGFSRLLTDKNLDTETRLLCSQVIQQNSELLLKLINDVIDLSNLGFDKIQFSINKYDAVNICRNVIDTVNKVKQTQAELVFTTNLQEMILETDTSRLQQVLINLLINATKFTPQGTINLNLQKEADGIAFFSVTDTGCGIPKDKQATIFQRFEKLNEYSQGSG
ncbi:MAG: histidine kinase dimerization/phospho-acceptor domain-containing protein, partial [Oscillospiraceae bacterium]|nr:histidine kinase dimerization/phospho-acceptor domain-containing protein [Oscillospiraceae bacterium]